MGGVVLANTPGAGAGAGAGGNLKKLARRKSSAAAAANLQTSSVPKSPTGYDWSVFDFYFSYHFNLIC